jgi:hypothetical protein
MRSPRLALRAVAAAFAVAITTPALADPTEDDRARARSLFDEGRALAKEGKYVEACPKLEESQRLDPGIGTLYNVGDCQEHTDRLASAWAAFNEVARLAKLTGQSDREAVARGRAEKLAPRLAKLRLRVPLPAPLGLRVVVDGKVVEVPPDADVPVDPGTHSITLTAPDHAPAERTVTMAPTPGLVIAVELPRLQPIAATPPDPVPMPPLPPGPGERAWGWQRTAAVAAAGAGVVGLGLGTYFCLRARSQWSDAEGNCPGNVCNDAGHTQWDDARSNARIADVALVSGVVLVAAGVVLWVLAPKSAEPRSIARSWR